MKPKLSIIIPCGPKDEDALKNLLSSIKMQQGYTKDDVETLVVREGNSEQAKAIGALWAKADILCFLCSDNYLKDRYFLHTMLWHFRMNAITGAYTHAYEWVREDKPLSRYFALLGANDPLCWWLGKADRAAYWEKDREGIFTFPSFIPSIGDNGFFVYREEYLKVVKDPDNHFPMDAIEDLRKIGKHTYYITSITTLWHKTGESWWKYFSKRYHYTKTLYFQQLHKRRWVMVKTKSDWLNTIGFGVCSLLIFPQLYYSIKGFRHLNDWAWFLHPVVCFLLTFIYGFAWLQHLVSRHPSLSPALVGANVSETVSRA